MKKIEVGGTFSFLSATFAPMLQPETLAYRIAQAFIHHPTSSQQQAIDVFTRFMCSPSSMAVMILRGSAGTGKTSLAAAFVKALSLLGIRQMLLAPTGRAAKVFALYAGHTAYTIHRIIYRQKQAATFSAFTLAPNKASNTLFIVDESSMISNDGHADALFGQGRLLDDLVQYVYSGNNCRLLLIGDSAQLPPVEQEQSPALQRHVLEEYGMDVFETTLSEVLRQSLQSGILANATAIRQLVEHDELTALPRITFKSFADISIVRGNELVETLANSYARVGQDETVVVTRSNKRANIYNQGIRAQVLDCEEELPSGDMLMVVKNNYYWAAAEGVEANSTAQKLAFIANGDRVRVSRVRNHRSFYGLKFVDLTLVFPDYDDRQINCTAILDTLTTEAPALTAEQQQMLYNGVMEDYAYIPLKRDRIEKIKNDIYYNALQIKFGYAVTCHKAQGGQWEHVYVDQGYMTAEMLTSSYLHWLYTAFTRATGHLYLVNWSEQQTNGDGAAS